MLEVLYHDKQIAVIVKPVGVLSEDGAAGESICPMIREALGKEEEECLDCSFGVRAMFPLAIATSIDALAVGVTFAFLGVKIVPAVSFIGVITFALSAFGVWLGNVFGSRFKSTAELAGGAVLILMGIKILLEHLGILA